GVGGGRAAQDRPRHRQGPDQGAAPQGAGRALIVRRAFGSAVALVLPFAVVAVFWQAFALYGPFPPKLFPTVDRMAAAFARLTATGVLPLQALHTLVRLAAGFALGGAVGVIAGLAMGRFRAAEDLLLPLVSVGNPIPGLAYAPLFVIWFG